MEPEAQELVLLETAIPRGAATVEVGVKVRGLTVIQVERGGVRAEVEAVQAAIMKLTFPGRALGASVVSGPGRRSDD